MTIKTVSGKQRLANLFLEFVVAALLILWIYTSISKIFDFHNFKTQLARSPFLAPFSDVVAYLIPYGELLLVLLLVVKRTRKLGLYLSFGLMLLFTGYIYIMLHYSYDLPCSCGGVLSKMSWEDHLYFNSMYTIIALIAIIVIEKSSVVVSANKLLSV